MTRISLLLPAVLVLATLTSCNRKTKAELALKTEQVQQLQEQLDHIQETNASLLDRMADLSVINKAGAESIQESLTNINEQNSYIRDLTQKIQTKDSLNLALVMNLKRSLSDINDQDVQVEVRGGMVHVSISDRLLFRSGSAALSSDALLVLGKVATVLNDHQDLNVLVEGHTDNVPFGNECLVDNWDLSVKRATAVVRALQQEHYVSPERLTAGGRSYHIPKASNDSPEGRSMNRRTEIIIAPKLDQFFKLLEAPDMVG